MDTQETNRGRNKKRRRWSNWLHKLHKQPDPESSAAIASFTAMLTAQSVLWQPNNFFLLFFGAELCRAEWERNQKRSAICKIKDVTIIGSARMLSSYMVLQVQRSLESIHNPLSVVFERNIEARHKEKTNTEEYSQSNFAKTDSNLDILNQQHPEDTVNRDEHETWRKTCGGKSHLYEGFKYLFVFFLFSFIRKRDDLPQSESRRECVRSWKSCDAGSWVQEYVSALNSVRNLGRPQRNL